MFNFFLTFKTPLPLLTPLLALLFLTGCEETPRGWGAGEVAPDTPLQWETEQLPWTHLDGTITPLAEYDITARVLRVEDYGDEMEDYSPYDFALGWGPMSDETILSGFSKITQSGRWFFVYWDERPPLSEKDIFLHSANVHLVPANDEIREQLSWVKAGDKVQLQGTLIRIERDRGWVWNSSTSRSDRANGSCELLWVDTVFHTAAPFDTYQVTDVTSP